MSNCPIFPAADAGPNYSHTTCLAIHYTWQSWGEISRSTSCTL